MDYPGYHHGRFILAQYKNLTKICLKDLIKTAVATSAKLDAYYADKCVFKPLIVKEQYRARFLFHQIRSQHCGGGRYQFLRAQADNTLNAGTRDAASFSAASRSILLTHLSERQHFGTRSERPGEQRNQVRYRNNKAHPPAPRNQSSQRVKQTPPR